MTNKINQAHRKFGRRVKRGVYNSCAKTGGLMKKTGGLGLIGTAGVNYFGNRLDKIPWIKMGLGKIFYCTQDLPKKVGITADGFLGDMDGNKLIAAYGASLGLMLGGYLLKRKARQKLNSL